MLQTDSTLNNPKCSLPFDLKGCALISAFYAKEDKGFFVDRKGIFMLTYEALLRGIIDENLYIKSWVLLIELIDFKMRFLCTEVNPSHKKNRSYIHCFLNKEDVLKPLNQQRTHFVYGGRGIYLRPNGEPHPEIMIARDPLGYSSPIQQGRYIYRDTRVLEDV